MPLSNNAYLSATMDAVKVFSAIFEPALLEELVQFGEIRDYKQGAIIMDYGKYIRMMPIVLKGTLKVSRMDDGGKEILLYYLSSNETCSMAYSCCLEAKKSEVRAVAEEDLTLIAIPHNKLDEWLCKYPGWKNYIMRSFNERFMELLKSIDSIAFHKLDERLLSYLKEKQRLTGSTLLNLSHSLIAEELATSRVVISRLLKQLENENKVLLYRNQIKLLRQFEES